MCLVRPDGTGVWLTPRPAAFDGVRALDGAYLEHALADRSSVEVSYQHGVQQRARPVGGGRGRRGRADPPDQHRRDPAHRDERLLMPPKSTFFTPKLRTGLVIRPLD